MSIAFNNSYSRLPTAFYETVSPKPVSEPETIACNHELAEELGIDPKWLDSKEALQILAGNRVPDGAAPLAMAYCGHQFGNLVPQLGDGRAILLGEVIDRNGERRDLQLKGSGRTPFSRGGDGRSALGPVLREYLVSEAMAALGVPTTRALAAVASGDRVHRETIEPGGVLARVARSHIRVGTFEWFAIRNDSENLQRLADYVIDRLYPESRETSNPYLTLLEQVLKRQARLMAQWMSFGFIHGVMNTDNTNLSGETIDYGPCAFMDAYHPAKKFSSIDHGGRYAYGNQATIAHWNLARLAETLLPLLADDRDAATDLANDALTTFRPIHQSELQQRFTAKIGLAGEEEESWELAQSLLTTMAETGADFTLTFRHLTAMMSSGDDEPFRQCFKDSPAIGPWLRSWKQRISRQDPTDPAATMRQANPIFIPRNHRIEAVIRAAYVGDYGPFHQLNDLLKHPFDEQPALEEYEAAPRPNEVVAATFCGT